MSESLTLLADRLQQVSPLGSNSTPECYFTIFANAISCGQSTCAEVNVKKVNVKKVGAQSPHGVILAQFSATKDLTDVWFIHSQKPDGPPSGPRPNSDDPPYFGLKTLSNLGEKLLFGDNNQNKCTHHPSRECAPSCYDILPLLPNVIANCIRPPEVPAVHPNNIGKYSIQQRWLFAVRVVESLNFILHRYLNEQSAETRDFQTRLALMRFVLLSAPFRDDFVRDWDWEDRDWEGVISQPHIVDRAGFAAHEWRERLLTYQSDDAALRWSSIVEREARLLVWETSLNKRDPLSISMKRILPNGHNESQDIAYVSESQRIRKHRLMARDFFLPRLMLRDAYVPPRLDNGRRRLDIVLGHPVYLIIFSIFFFLSIAFPLYIANFVASRWGLSSTVLQTFIPAAWHNVVVGFLVHPLIGSVFLTGCLFLGINVWRIAVHNPGVAYPMCLRMPAVTGIGLAALFTVDATVWQANQQWSVVVLFVFLALGYVFIEARNHDVHGRDAARRSLLVVLVGLAQSFFVAAAGLKFLAPVLAERFVQPSNWIDAAWSLSFVASGGLALGVFLQVLWESRPITYPLTHLEWTDRSDRAAGSLFGGR